MATKRAGIMNGTCAAGLPIASMTKPKGRDSSSTKVRWSTTRSARVAAISRRPIPSRRPQRFSEATQSSAVTGVPSCHSSPGRSVKVQVRRSSLACQDSSICGRYSPASSIAISVSKTM